MTTRWTPEGLVGCFCMLLVAACIVSSLVGWNSPLLLLNESQVLYLFSTSAQVVAGVYGLTLTGFVFFRNELSREESEDETLVEAVESLKLRYFKLLMFVTVLSVMTFVLANLAISHESSEHRLLNTIVINCAQSVFVVNLLAIAHFIFEVISPQRIEKESRNLQVGVDPVQEGYESGSLEEFLRNYNGIEALLQKYGQAFDGNVADFSPRRHTRRMSNAKLAQILFRSERISESLFGELRSLITLRNSIVHGAEPVVSDKMVEVSRRVLDALSSELQAGPLSDGANEL